MNKHRRKTLELANWGKGAFVGAREHRYGSSSKISLAGPKPKPKPIITSEKRAHLVSLVMDGLADWRLSPFENEAKLRTGLRASFCLHGHEWEQSDNEASTIVALAFERIGAKRPDHIEGQVHFTAGYEYCNWCLMPMEEVRRSRGQRYCSTVCANRAIKFRGENLRQTADSSIHAAYKFMADERAAPRVCPHCEKEYRSREKEQRYCTHRCSLKARHAEERKKLAGVMRKCGCCHKDYEPTADKSMYCSIACQSTAASRLYYRRNRKMYSHTCEWCEDKFNSKMPWARYCSKQHGRLAYKASKKPSLENNVIYLTAEMFDRAFGRQESVPAENALSEIIDRLFA